jgi:hypothetical protein
MTITKIKTDFSLYNQPSDMSKMMLPAQETEVVKTELPGQGCRTHPGTAMDEKG